MGKLLTLVAVLRCHYGDLEYDLTQIQVTLSDFWRGDLSIRWLSNHVERMIAHPPRGSALIAAAFPDLATVTSWSVTDHLVADVFDGIAAAHNLVDQTKKPARIKRPGVELQKRATDDARRAALIERYEARQKGAT